MLRFDSTFSSTAFSPFVLGALKYRTFIPRQITSILQDRPLRDRGAGGGGGGGGGGGNHS